MLEIAGGVILGGIGLFLLYCLFMLMSSGPNIFHGLAEGWKGFKEGMRGK